MVARREFSFTGAVRPSVERFVGSAGGVISQLRRDEASRAVAALRLSHNRP